METATVFALLAIYWMLSRIDDQAKRASDALERIADALEDDGDDEMFRPIDPMEAGR
jgi:hypothetical protein